MLLCCQRCVKQKLYPKGALSFLPTAPPPYRSMTGNHTPRLGQTSLMVWLL
jgi:hypothetical protein